MCTNSVNYGKAFAMFNTDMQKASGSHFCLKI